MSAAHGLRVVQWATGNIGTYALRGVIEHPDLSLVGLYVHSDAKAGKDAGSLCGLPPVGVAATRSVDEIVELGADCVLYMPAACDFDEVCRVLASGANVVTTRGEFHHPAGLPADARAKVEAACAEGGTSIHSTGSSPGFITEAVPLVLASIQRRIDNLAIAEFADLSQRDSPDLLFRIMGYGKDPGAFDQRRWAHGAASFGPSLHLVAEALGLPLDEVTSTGEVAVAAAPLTIAAGDVPEGTVAAQRMIVNGLRAGRPLLTFSATWYCSKSLDPAWDVRDTGWRLTVDGDAPLDIEIRFPIPLDRMAATTPAYTANRAVNAIAPVCAAAPGLRTTLDLPHIVPTLR